MLLQLGEQPALRGSARIAADLTVEEWEACLLDLENQGRLERCAPLIVSLDRMKHDSLTEILTQPELCDAIVSLTTVHLFDCAELAQLPPFLIGGGNLPPLPAQILPAVFLGDRDAAACKETLQALGTHGKST